MSTKIELLKKGIEVGRFPKTVYKYRDLSDWTYKIIENKSMWFAKPDTFNDPFDCNLSEVTTYEASDFLNFIDKFQEISLIQKKEITRQYQLNPYGIINKIVNSRKILNEKGILSLSKNNSNILMWSHYANCHKGVTLGFDMHINLEFFLDPVIIDYCDSYNATNYLKDGFGMIKDNISKKSTYWKYEEEIRIYKPQSGLHEFIPNALQEIHFGCKVEDNEINKFINHCKQNDFDHVKFFKAQIKHSYFSLDFIPL